MTTQQRNDCRCHTCRHFEQKSEQEGICRLQPPKVYVVGGAYLETAWPAVTINDFCGSWSDQAATRPGC